MYVKEETNNAYYDGSLFQNKFSTVSNTYMTGLLQIF
jgi:hypothetical protein